MTGNFKITLLYDTVNEGHRWIVRNCNIHPSKDYDERVPNRKRFYGIIDFKEFLKEIPNDLSNQAKTSMSNRKIKQIERLTQNYIPNKNDSESFASNQLTTDAYRKLTLKEYTQFGRILKSVGKQYNKKLDKIIDIK